MSDPKTITDLSEDEMEAVTTATALVLMGLQEAQKNNREEEIIFHGKDLIAAYLEVHMGLDQGYASQTATSFLVHAVEEDLL